MMFIEALNYYFSDMLKQSSLKVKIILSLTIIFLSTTFAFNSFAQKNENTSPTYDDLISQYKELDKNHSEIELYTMGESDVYGIPIYVCLINGTGDSLQSFQKAKSLTTVLINNAIHAGEPDGVNASLQWIENWIKAGKKKENLPVIAIIPAYNVGGMNNRSSCSRINQEGPEEYGFRANAQNLDLNRDFIKMDSENAKTFARIYQALDPDVFVDTHVSNGADYQYTLTYIAPLKERMAPSTRNLMYQELIPDLTKRLKKKKWDLFQYVELRGETPESGIQAFNDLPRYAMGYASLFDALSFTTETHMLKPFPQRVKATYDFIDDLISYTGSHSEKIEDSRKQAREYWMEQEYFKFNFGSTDKKDSILFKGYAHSFPESTVTGLERLKYDRSKPYEQYVPLYQTYISNDSILIPSEFYIGSQEKDIIERFAANQIEYTRLTKDTIIYLTIERITSFNSPSRPYEGHFIHSQVKTNFEKKEVHLKKGDLLVPTKQMHRQFILSTLVARAEDSYFNWNFMDSYVQQKEYFSPYVFEDLADDILEKDQHLKKEYEILKMMDPKFASSSFDQLLFIYRNCNYFEPTFNLLPVYYKY